MTTETPPATAAPSQPAPNSEAAPVAAPITPIETPPAAPVTPPAAETPPPPPPPGIGPDGKLAENWFLALGDEFAPHAKDLSKHKDIRSIITELDYFRKNGVEYPAEGSPTAAIDRFRKIAGVPETAEGYGLNAETVKLPEGMEFDTELAAAITAAAHKTHTPPAALMEIVGEFNNLLATRTRDAHAEHQKALKAAQDNLVAEWRGDYQQNASTVRHLTGKLAEASGIEPDNPALQTLANSPEFARMMLHVSKLTSEDRINVPTGYGELKSPSQKIADIKEGRDPVWSAKFNSGSETDRLAAYEHMKRLREQAAT